jgi:formyltetrahydrofolate-dependent phosphoribosylglycinamide formyltransferase
MLNKLQQKWKVTGPQLILILCTFAVTGSLTAYISRSITSWVGFDESTAMAWKILLRLSILVFGYQVIILIVSFFFGQFSFFWNYEKKILKRMGILKNEEPKNRPYKLAIFASGKGSNAEKIIQYFDKEPLIEISLVVCNRPGAGVLEIASHGKTKTLLIEKQKFIESDDYVQYLKNEGITHIILAGFLWKIPKNLIDAFPEKILNIHPALLPNFGGKGMYGEKVHQAVIASGEKESGITIHLVDEHYDHGKTIFQAKTEVLPIDTAETLAQKIHELEHLHYPRVIAEWLGSM